MRAKSTTQKTRLPIDLNGAGRVTRTPDLRITNALLYQLSYAGTGKGRKVYSKRPVCTIPGGILTEINPVPDAPRSDLPMTPISCLRENLVQATEGGNQREEAVQKFSDGFLIHRAVSCHSHFFHGPGQSLPDDARSDTGHSGGPPPHDCFQPGRIHGRDDCDEFRCLWTFRFSGRGTVSNLQRGSLPTPKHGCGKPGAMAADPAR
jgi:hypothetical protein